MCNEDHLEQRIDISVLNNPKYWKLFTCFLLPSLRLVSQSLSYQLFMDEMLCAVVFCCLLFCCCVVICVVFCFVSIADNPFTLHFKTTYGTGNVNFHIQFHNFNPNSVIFKMQTLLHTTKQPKFPNLHPSCFSIRNCKAMAASTMTGGSVSSVKQIRAEFTAVARFLSSLKVMSPKLCNTQHA